MTKRREIEAQLALYGDLTGIIKAMRSFALVELRRIGQRETACHQAMQTMSEALQDMAPALLPPRKIEGDIWLLFGSVRGFCGSFNEDIHRTWCEGGSVTPVVAVGERLAVLLPEDETVSAVAGATGVLDASATIDRILTAIGEVRERNKGELGLVAALRDEAGVTLQRLLPLHSSLKEPDSTPLPLTNEAPSIVARGVAEHYLFHTLFALMLRSIRMENHMRLTQMENALSHLEQGTEQLQRKRNRLRQEEIIEEIELIAGGETLPLP